MWFGAAGLSGPSEREAQGPTLYVLAGGRDRADFVRNLRAEPAVTVVLDEREHRATARVVQAGTDEDALARRLLLDKYQAPGSHDLEGWGRRALAVAFDLAD